MKQIIGMLTSSVAIVLLSACGGGGSNDTIIAPISTPTHTPTHTPTPTPAPSYKTLNDLEFKKLDLDRNWKSGTVTSKTFEFADTYMEDTGKYALLQDELGTKDSISACTMSVEGLSETYLCLNVLSHGAATAYGMSIDEDGKVTGIFDYSLTGNTYELADGLYYDWLDDGTISGKADPVTQQDTQEKIAEPEDISMEDDLEISETSDTTNNAILQQTIDDIYYILLDRL